MKPRHFAAALLGLALASGAVYADQPQRDPAQQTPPAVGSTEGAPTIIEVVPSGTDDVTPEEMAAMQLLLLQLLMMQSEPAADQPIVAPGFERSQAI